MAEFWKYVRRRALLHEPTDRELRCYLECYRAGYERGIVDVRKRVGPAEWSSLTRAISERLATDRSPLEAGCWLAGMRSGRIDALAGPADLDAQLERTFCEQWESNGISDCALECDPRAVKLRRLLAAVFAKRTTQPIKDRLGGALLN